MKPTDKEIDDALTVLRADYYSEVRALAEDLIARAKSGELAGEESLDDAMHESIDGHERVIHTHKSQLVVALSDNSSAAADAHGAEGLTAGDDINWALLAYSAMRADVGQYLAGHERLEGPLFPVS